MAELQKAFEAKKTKDDYAWDFRDEEAYGFLEKKYHNRRLLWEASEHARRQADDAELIGGAPNPQYRRLVLEAEVAKLRYEMAYMVDKNKQLATLIEPLEFLFQRVGILEGAYGHVKLLAETAHTDYNLLEGAMKKLSEMYDKFKKGAK